MNKVLKDLPLAIAYLDDIIFYGKTAEEHLNHLQQVFHKLHDAELSMKLSMCYFFPKEIQYLGHVLSTTCITPLPSKTAAIKMMTPTKNAKQVRTFFGLVGYYCKFIMKFSWIEELLTALTHYDVKFAWTTGDHAAFNTLKNHLDRSTYPSLPSSFKLLHTIHICSDEACGAQLSQEYNGQELLAAFYSHTFTDIQ